MESNRKEVKPHLLCCTHGQRWQRDCDICETIFAEDLRRVRVADRNAALGALVTGLSIVGITAFLCWLILP